MAQNQIVCQFCETSTVVKWKCVHCDLILCENCKTKIHSKIQTSEEHNIIDLKEFNSASAVETIRSLDVKNIPCTNHASEKCIIYCQDCETLLCSLCLIESHHDHANHKFGKIANIYQEKLQELKNLEGISNNSLILFSETEKELDEVLSNGETQYNAIKQKILTREEEIKQATTQQSENLVKELDKLWKPEKDQIVRRLGEIREKKGGLSQQVTHIKETLLSEKAVSIFTACDKTRGISKNIPAPPTKTENSVKQIILSQPRPVENLVSLGFIRTVPELKVKQSYHSDLHHIKKIKTTANGTNILCSYEDEVICQFEFKDSKCLTTKVAQKVNIIDMTLTKQGKLLFTTIYNNSEVKCLTSVSPDAKIETHTSISPLCARAIHATDNNILIGFHDNGYHFPLTKDRTRGILVQDYNGRHIRTLEYDTNNDRIFSLPQKLTTNINGDICVVDREDYVGERRVVVLTELGSVKWTYTGHTSINTKHKFTPWDIVTTNEGFILVADCDSNAIHMLSMDGELLTSLSDRHGIKSPMCLNIDKSGKLMIGCSSASTKDNVAKIHVVEFNI